MGDNEQFKDNQTSEEQQENREQKTYTQEEVDEIIRKRLARERRKNDRAAADKGHQKTSGEAELESRELRVIAMERLIDSGMPTSLADVLKYTDEESLEEAIDTIKNLNLKAPGAQKSWGLRHGGSNVKRDSYRDAMGLK